MNSEGTTKMSSVIANDQVALRCNPEQHRGDKAISTARHHGRRRGRRTRASMASFRHTRFECQPTPWAAKSADHQGPEFKCRQGLDMSIWKSSARG